MQPEIDKDKRIGKAEARPHPGNPSWIEPDALRPTLSARAMEFSGNRADSSV